jgi:hypothetical protein
MLHGTECGEKKKNVIALPNPALLKDALCGCWVTKQWVLEQNRISQNVERRDCGLFYGAVLAFACQFWERILFPVTHTFHIFYVCTLPIFIVYLYISKPTLKLFLMVSSHLVLSAVTSTPPSLPPYSRIHTSFWTVFMFFRYIQQSLANPDPRVMWTILAIYSPVFPREIIITRPHHYHLLLGSTIFRF